MATNQRVSRSIAPAATSIHDAADASLVSVAPTTSPKRLVYKRANTPSACLACKKRRKKCSGGPSPCNACVEAHTECLFDKELDLRRKTAVKRQIEEAQVYKDLLSRLLISLRTSDEGDAQCLLRLIRDGRTISEIVGYIDTTITRRRESSSSPETDEVIDDLLQVRSSAMNLDDESRVRRARRKVLSIEEMNDTPLINVPAEPWTTVTQDDDLVSHLMSLYLTWGSTYEHPIVQDIFIEAMLTRDVNSPLCSPFLVNAILGLAAHSSVAPGSFFRPGDLLSRGKQFYNEARRLWDEGDCTSSLTNLQGLYVLFLDSNLRGKDKMGWLLMSQAVQMHHDLELSQKIKVPKNCPEELHTKMEKSFSKLAWALASSSTIVALALLKRPPLAPPLVPRPNTAAEMSIAISWSPYPRQTRKEMVYCNAVFDAYCDLSKIIYEVASSVTFRTGAGPQSEIEAFTDRLQSWHENLPNNIKIYQTAPEPVLDLHLLYYWLALALSEFGQRASDSSLKSENAAEIMAPKICARSISLIHQAMPLFRNYRQAYGIARVGAMSSHVASVMCYILLKALDNPENEQALIDLCIWLTVGARNWMVYAGVLRSFRPTAQQLHVRLPPKVDELLQDFEENLWNQTKHKRLNSVLPNLSLVVHPADAEDFALGDLLARWEILKLDR